MLDECKGEKFEAVLAAFSTIVLHKALGAEKERSPAVARQLAQASKLKPGEQKSLLPLAIAHRASLTAILHRKEQQRSRYLQLQRVLDQKALMLDEQRQRLMQKEKVNAYSDIPETSLKHIRQKFDTFWQGDPRWLNIIFHGEGEQSHDSLLEAPFDRIWNQVANGKVPTAQMSHGQDGMLRDLENRVATQQARLHRWKQYREKLAREAKGSTTEPSPKSPPKAAPEKAIDFSAYKAINARQREVLQRFTEQMPDRSHPVPLPEDNEYAQLIKSMQRDLDDIDAPKRTSFNHIQDIDSSRASTSKQRANPGRIPIQLADGRRPRQEPPEHSLTMQDQKALWVTQSSNWSGALPPAVSETPKKPLSRESQATSVVDTPETHKKDSSFFTQAPSSRLTGTTLDIADHPSLDMDEDSMLAAQIIAATMNAGPSPVKAKSSLMERARKSMALASPADWHHSLPVPADQANHDKRINPEVASKTIDDTKVTLLERTRQSMSLLPAQSREPRKSQHRHRHSKQFPTNQFETPRKQAPIMEDLVDTTPPEKLFSDDADYASVFKSRPKIAMSPTGSPALEASPDTNALIDSIRDQDHADHWGSSPLARAAGKAGL